MPPASKASVINSAAIDGLSESKPKDHELQNRSLSRREILGLLGTTAATALFGCDRPWPGFLDFVTDAYSSSPAAAAAIPPCTVRPEQTEGPYFVDHKLNRTDIRVDPADGSVTPGVSLQLSFHVSRVAGGSCSPLHGAIVDIWQCDARGMYSGVRDLYGRFDTTGKVFLRGFQITGKNGMVDFLTIYPGWYGGRAVHIHFKIRSNPSSARGHEFTSQLYFDEAVTDQVFDQFPYNSKTGGRTKNAQDFGFRRGGKRLMPTISKDAQGYAAAFDIGLRI